MLENQALPEPLLLPIIMVPEDVMTFLDELPALAMENPNILLQHDRFFLQIIRSVSRLHQLYLAKLRKNGHEALANQYQRRFSLLLDQRMKRWNMMLNLNEFDLSRAASQ